jgi:hypothetical protein
MATSGTDTAGRTSRRFRPAYVIIGLVAAVAAFGWAYVMAHVGQTPGIVAQTITFRVLSDHAVEIDYSVTKPTGSEVRCVLQAVDVNHAEVAHMAITVPGGTAHVARLQRLATSARATSTQVKDCAVM